MDVVTAFRFAVDRAPGRVAVVEHDRSLTYRQLLDEVERVRSGLVGIGVGRGDRVVFAVANSLDATVALLAALAAGAVVVPINFRAGPAAVRTALEATQARAFVVDRHSEPGVGDWPGHVVGLGGAASERPAGTALADLGGPPVPVAALRASDPAFALFTSGSTGAPKQIPLTHGMSLARVYGLFMNHGFRSDDDMRCLGLMPLHHTVGLHAVLLLSLLTGGTYYPVGEFDPPAVLSLVVRHRITYVFAAPTMFARLSAENGVEEATTSVRDALYAGAPMDPSLVRAVSSRMTDNLTHIYGNTETFNSLYYRYAGSCPGALVPGVLHRVRLVAPGGRPDEVVEHGEGELLVDMSSPEAFAGYADPARDAGRVEGGWYRTGDMAVRDDEGRVFIRGRVDDMIITGGENVYPAEVEAALVEHPGITDCAVIGVPDATWGELVTAVVVRADPGLAEDDVLRHARESSLESFRRPRRVVFVASIPVNATGKRSLGELRRLAGAS
jgi:2-furoate---CoA ligase